MRKETIQKQKKQEKTRQQTNIMASEELLRLLDIGTPHASTKQQDATPEVMISPTTLTPSISENTLPVQRSRSLPHCISDEKPKPESNSTTASFKVPVQRAHSLPSNFPILGDPGPSYTPSPYTSPMIDDTYHAFSPSPPVPLPACDFQYQYRFNRSPTPLSDTSSLFSQVWTDAKILLLPKDW